MNRYYSLILIGVGIFLWLVAAGCYWQRITPKRLKFEKADEVLLREEHKEGAVVPIELSIESVGMRLAVYGANNEGDKWETTKGGVSYLSGSAIPGERGNSIFYGHNWKSLLGDLGKVKPGEMVEITMSDGSERMFVVKYVQEVSPRETEILRENNERRVIIYTCSGFLDRKRVVVTALAQGDPGDAS